MLRKICVPVGCAVLAWATPAWAEDVAANGPPIDKIEQAAADDAALEPLSDDTLIALRGGEALTVANQTLVAITSGNVINGDYAAGSVSLSDFALSNFNGLGNLLINTGAQVSLQTGMNLTINVGD